ncbi:uncharacterized protein LOC143779956 isoform X6 [Ranitomeya variabilis]|uniref:uncharacterized protein LOC143779956 isoform X6 n=1 Tax=Ranitomeya variabilis TaxID=490064 RepID=UPI004055C3B9
MGRVEFFALWSVLEAPRQFISKGGRRSFQLLLPLPLPQYLFVFGLGDWDSYSGDSCVVAELLAGSMQPQCIGLLSAECRSLVWDGEWSLDIVKECTRLTMQGMPAKLCLTVSGKGYKGLGFSSSTPARRISIGPPSSPMLSESTIAHEKGYSAEVVQRASCAILKDSPPRSLPSKDAGARSQDPFCQRANIVPRNPRRLRFGSKGSEDGTAGAVCPSGRWGHSVCLCDPETAVLIGGEGANEKSSPDSLWKLELDSDFWFQMDGLCSAPQCSRGHTATFDPESKKVYVYGGMWEKSWLRNVYVLDTQDWKWTLLAVGADSGVCTNVLYIFNPEYKIWYQPIVEGERPLPRYGHSATLLGNRLVLFGGRRAPSPVYLNDVHILDLGYMEYTAVVYPSLSERPSPRCFHAAMQVSEHKVLVHGGCSGSGSLTDTFIFNLGTLSWSPIRFGGIPQMPRAGHTLLNLSSSSLTDSDKEECKRRSLIQVLVIGGSDGAGTFYSDYPKVQVDLSV